MKKAGFSKKLLIADYIVALCLILFLIYAGFINATYIENIQAEILETGALISISTPYDLGNLTIILSIWIGQLGISSAAYYMMSKSDHKIQLPMQLIESMPNDLQEKVDMTTIITSVLSSTDI